MPPLAWKLALGARLYKQERFGSESRPAAHKTVQLAADPSRPQVSNEEEAASMRNVGARIANGVLGAWLFTSAFLWPHSYQQFNNAWLMGMIVMMCSAIAFTAPRFRLANTAIGVWLIVSAFLLHSISTLTMWNHLLVGIGVALASLLPGSADAWDPEPVGFLS